MSEYRLIPLTGKRGLGKFAKVSLEDYESLSQWSWWVNDSGYAVRSFRADGRQQKARMHRQIMGAADGVEVDHINGDPLDNRRSNLRFCTSSQNKQNRHVIKGISTYHGVMWHTVRSKWRASIKSGGSGKHLGLFETELDAAIAYDVAARHLHGEFATLNFPDGFPPYANVPDVNKLLSQKGSSSVKGVHWSSGERKWKAAATVDGKRKHLGTFVTEVEAVNAVNEHSRTAMDTRTHRRMIVKARRRAG